MPAKKKITEEIKEAGAKAGNAVKTAAKKTADKAAAEKIEVKKTVRGAARKTKEMNEPRTSALDESQSAKASATLLPSMMPPV